MSRNADGYAVAIDVRNMMAGINTLEMDIMCLSEHVVNADNGVIKDVAGFETSLRELSDDAKRLEQRYALYKNLKHRKPEAGK